jgi:hypothetical protein
MHDPIFRPESVLRGGRWSRARRLAYGLVGAVLAVVPVVASGTPAAAAPQVRPAALAGARFVLAGFGTQQGWQVDRHPRFMADITGDGRADIVGFGDAGVTTSVALGDGGFAAAQLVVGDLGYNQGWRIGTNPRFVTDITGDRRADIVAIGNAGVYTAVSSGNGGFGPLQFESGIFSASSPGGEYFMADMNGDGRSDIYNVNSAGVEVALALGNGQFAPPTFVSRALFLGFKGSPFDDFQVADVTGDGRAEIIAVSTNGPIRNVVALPQGSTYGPPLPAQADATSSPLFNNAIADITGDGKADLVGFDPTQSGSWSAVSRGDGTFTDFARAADNFGAGAGWDFDHPVTLGDVNGDGRADIVGFGSAGVWTATAVGNGTFAPSQFVLAAFGSDPGAGSWHTASHPRFVTDITGDGKADIVGFGDAGVYTSVSN